MKFSIVIPTYNAEKYFSRCLMSIIHQGVNTEIIVVDGYSTDKTLSILRNTREFIKWYPNIDMRVVCEVPKGEPDAINKGLKLCTGDIIAYIDADDIYLPNAFKTVQLYLFSHNAEWVYGKCKVIDGNGHEIRQIVTKAKELLMGHYSYQALLCVDFIPQPSVFFTKRCIDTIGGVCVTERLVFDYEWWLKIGRTFKPAYINSYLSAWRAHEGSSSVKGYVKQAKDALRVQRSFGTNLLQYPVCYGTILLYKLMELTDGRTPDRAETTLEQSGGKI